MQCRPFPMVLSVDVCALAQEQFNHILVTSPCCAMQCRPSPLGLTSAPLLKRMSTTSLRPRRAASCNGVHPPSYLRADVCVHPLVHEQLERIFVTLPNR